jgi:hypothetical protein
MGGMRIILITALCLFAGAANAVTFMGTPALVISDGDGDINPTLDSIDTTTSFGPGDTVTSISISITLTHTYVGDLALELIAPDLTELQLFARPGSGIGDELTGCPCGNFRSLNATVITFADGSASAETLGDFPPFGDIPSGTYSPDADGWTTGITLVAEFIGLQADGLWTLRVGDYAAGDVGTVDSWMLNIEAVPEPSTHLLVALGLGGIAFAGRPRKR